MLIKPEHRGDCDFIIQTLFAHEVSNLKVYNERDLIKKYYTPTQFPQSSLNLRHTHGCLTSG